jgi:hypothetical protein
MSLAARRYDIRVVDLHERKCEANKLIRVALKRSSKDGSLDVFLHKRSV